MFKSIWEERKGRAKIVLSILVVSIMMMPLMMDNVANANVKTEKKSIPVSTGFIKNFDGTSWGHTVIQTSDGGYLIGGGTGYDEGSDALLIKTDSEGNMEWETTYGDSIGWDAFEGLVETYEGDFVASGIKSGKGFLAKVDANGNHTWEKTYGGSTNGYCIDLRQTLDDGFILTGNYYSEPRNGWLIKTDSEGNEIWSKMYGGDFQVTLHSVKITNDNGFILSGWKTPEKGLFDNGYVVKTDEEGNIEWEKIYTSGDFFHSGMQTSDGGYVFTGGKSILKRFNLCQLCLVKTDSNGDEIWSKYFGTPYFSEMSLWIEETRDGGFVIIGHFLGIGLAINYIQNGVFMPLWSKIWIIKTDANGTLEWDNKEINGYGRCVKQTSDDGFIITGQKGAYNKPKGVILIKTDENGNID
jgi:hypothetical protein